VPGVRSSDVRSSDLGALAVFEFCETLHAVGGNYRWRLLDDGQPWHRPAHCAEIAGGAESTAVDAGVVVEWSGGFFSIWTVSFCGRDAVCLLPGSVICVWAGGQDLSDVYREPDAAWDRGPLDRGDSGGGDVELECSAELAGIELDHGFLSALSCGQSFRLSPGAERSGTAATGATRDRRMGAGAVRAGGTGAAPGGTRGRSRIANR